MSRTNEVAERFDRISEVYDETREPLSNEATERLAQVLSRDGSRKLLEVGIGTGRIARPLQDRRFEITGVDLSKGMLQKARTKGLEDLVRGDANHLPFADKSIDTVVLAHVLHLLEDPPETFGKIARIARKKIVAVVRSRDDSSRSPDDGRHLIMQAFVKAAKEIGYPIPRSSGDWRDRLRRETEFITSFPPNELVTLQDSAVVTTIGERISFFEKRAYGYPSDIPDDVFRGIMENVKSSMDLAREIRYRRVEQAAVWLLRGN